MRVQIQEYKDKYPENEIWKWPLVVSFKAETGEVIVSNQGASWPQLVLESCIDTVDGPRGLSYNLTSRADTVESLSRIRSWIVGSYAEDQAFQEAQWPAAHSFLPRRVVHLTFSSEWVAAAPYWNDEPPVRLIELHRSTQGRYVALSHCWRESGPLATKVSTLGERLNMIDVRKLSPTLRDAIALTRYMRIPYLWIDSVCIIQDSKEHWEEESAKMGSYYGNALFTITAGRKKSKGLFGERKFSLASPHYKLTLPSS